MGVFVVLYRGINVGGKNMVKMESLRAMHEGLGHRSVQSYVQSGNVVLSARGSAGEVARKTAAAFAGEFGFAAKVMVVDAGRWGGVVEGNPYAAAAGDDPTTVHVGFCEGEPDGKGLDALLAKTGGREAFVAGKGIIYLHAPDGVGRSKFAAGMERACGVPTTVRNWRTVEALWKMTSAVA
jgi:uncharacterized protein (DUF1697 family)